MRRTELELYASVLEAAKKGALKYDLFLTTWTPSFKEVLKNLVEANLLSVDESNLKIREDGQSRNTVYKTTEKGNEFLRKLEDLQNLLKRD